MKTISHEQYGDLVEADVFLNSIKEILGAKTAREALERVKDLVSEVGA